MRSSTSFSEFVAVGCLAALLCLTGIPAHAGGPADYRPGKAMRIAILPILNLSGTSVPLRELRGALLANAAKRGVTVLEEAALERFMAKHRVRYAGGLDESIARPLHDEAGTEGVLVTALQQYDRIAPPKITIEARLVSTGPVPEIIWADAVSMAGDDAPGLFGRGLIDDPAILAETAVERLAGSLAAALEGGKAPAREKVAGKHLPRIAFRSPELKPEERSRIAVVPFLNKSQRGYAGEILALHFVRELARRGDVTVIEPGVVRQKLLAFRVIMEDGLSLANADILFEVLDADFILSGSVQEYDDYEGSIGTPQVAFSAWLLDRKSRRVVMAAESHNSGDEGIHPFELGKLRTAHTLGAAMVSGITGQIPAGTKTGSSGTGPREGTGQRNTTLPKEGEL
jgi:TolB-like protein